MDSNDNNGKKLILEKVACARLVASRLLEEFGKEDEISPQLYLIARELEDAERLLKTEVETVWH